MGPSIDTSHYDVPQWQRPVRQHREDRAGQAAGRDLLRRRDDHDTRPCAGVGPAYGCCTSARRHRCERWPRGPIPFACRSRRMQPRRGLLRLYTVSRRMDNRYCRARISGPMRGFGMPLHWNSTRALLDMRTRNLRDAHPREAFFFGTGHNRFNPINEFVRRIPAEFLF
jgi:hypothetical protein